MRTAARGDKGECLLEEITARRRFKSAPRGVLECRFAWCVVNHSNELAQNGPQGACDGEENPEFKEKILCLEYVVLRKRTKWGRA